MIEKRFTEEKFNKVQGYLNEIGAFKIESNEDNKVFIDRFRKLVDDVRSIDESEVPTDLNLMAVLKKAMIDDVVLWGNLEFNSDNMSLSRMMEIISKWKPKDSKKSSAVANYSVLPGNLEKAHAKKQGQDRPSSCRNESMPRLQESWALGQGLPQQGGERRLDCKERKEAGSP